MFEKNLKLAYLLDFYGDVLDDHTGKTMHLYYDDDLSLSEIANGLGISRQGVRHIIKKGEDQLLFLEEKLGLATRHSELISLAEKFGGVLSRINTEDPRLSSEDISLLRSLIDVILANDT